MDLLLIVLAILAIVIATMYRQEHMTNKDMMSKLQTYGTKDESKKNDTPSQAPIYGPRAEQPTAPAPTASNGKGAANNGSGTYPEIYGPEYQGVPGMKQKNPKHESDDTSDETYDYNPDLQKAFPTSGPPQPFLTDFSRFQK